MLRTALRNVLAHRARLVMTALAITLGVAFVSGTLVFGDTVTQALRGAAARNLKDVAVVVQSESESESEPERGSGDASPGGRSTALTAELAERVRTVPGVTSVHPVVEGTATLAAKDGRPLNADSGGPNLAVNYAPDEPGTDRDSRIALSAGRGPATGAELALDRRTAEKAGYRLGDVVRFATDGPTLTGTLVGIVTTDDPRVSAGGSLLLLDTATAQRLLLRAGRFDSLSVGSAPGTDEQALADRVRALLPAKGITVTSGARLAREQARQIAENTKELTRMLPAFAAVALFVGVFTIANTFTMLVAQRSRETALLRAVGASRRQVVRAVLAEAGLLGLAASAAGLALGLGIATALPRLLAAGGGGLPDGPLVVSADTLVRSLLVGVGVTLVAAWLPARRAARTAPVAALSAVDQAPPPRGLLLRNCLGGLLTGAGVATMLYVSTQRDGGDLNLKAAGLGSVLTLTGMIVLAPLLSRPVIRLAGVVTTRLFGVGGRLAEGNALRNPRRTAATASALMIGLTLITGLSVTGSSMSAALEAAAVGGLTADLKVSSAGPGLDPAFGAKAAAVPGVAQAAPVAVAALGVRGGYATLTGADPQRLAAVSDLRFSSGSLAELGPGRVALSEQLAARTGLAKGDTFEAALGSGHGRKALTVVGVYRQTRAVGGALATLDEVLPHAYGGRLDSILVKAAPGRAVRGLDEDIRKALGGSPLLQVQDREQLTKAESGRIGPMLDMMYGLLGLTVVIGVFGVVNTLAMSVVERTREIGLLRAVGLDRAGVRRMVRLESVVISLFGAVLGIGTGCFLAWACGSLSTSSLPQYETVLPWGRLGLFLLLGPAIGVLAALWPARWAARLDLLRAIGAQ
ncbi:FtsX-like permease family protein [Kitasatospora sp. NPDC002227]|uniref:ABC transporter permease n=1 Tax=Kitasatospora sp. NPDC002227 TaxID=3154773 RepID=UPI00332DB62E